MPRTEAVDGPIQTARHAKAIYEKMTRHKGFSDRAFLTMNGKPQWHDDFATFEERYNRNRAIADECENRILAWMDQLIVAERKR